MIRIYLASKMDHAERWRNLANEYPEIHFVSHWCYLEPFVEPSAANATKFWQDDFHNIARCDMVIVYAEPEEKLRGALVEAGIAIGLGKTVVVVGEHPDFGTWSYHPQVKRAVSLHTALAFAQSLKAS